MMSEQWTNLKTIHFATFTRLREEKHGNSLIICDDLNPFGPGFSEHPQADGGG